MAEIPQWHVTGDWFDVCSCDIACPCIFGQPPTNNICRAVMAYHVGEGHSGDVPLAGLNLVIAITFKGNIWAGQAALTGPVGPAIKKWALPQEELRKIPERVIAEQKFERQRDIAADLYQDLENRFQAARLAESITVGDLTILDRPGVSFAPISDPRRQVLLMFLGGALALALAAAILRDRLDPRIQYPDQVTGDMGLNVLGAVPALRGGRLGPADMALAVEAFRSIQLSLTHAVGNGGPLTVTFTSPGASDGKSFVTSNLAIAFADMGHRTLVIDGDVRRGSMHKLLGANHKPGLTDFLSGRIERAAVIQETRYPMLHFVGCGSRQESGPKLLGSPTMREFMRELRSDYDVILVDSPPLGACVDPMILATLTKNMVLVVRTGSTDRSLAESRLDAVDRLPVRVVGAVLNDVEQGGAYRYYSYVSGYEILDDEADAEALPGGNGRPDDGSNPTGDPAGG